MCARTGLQDPCILHTIPFVAWESACGTVIAHICFSLIHVRVWAQSLGARLHNKQAKHCLLGLRSVKLCTSYDADMAFGIAQAMIPWHTWRKDCTSIFSSNNPYCDRGLHRTITLLLTYSCPAYLMSKSLRLSALGRSRRAPRCDPLLGRILHSEVCCPKCGDDFVQLETCPRGRACSRAQKQSKHQARLSVSIVYNPLPFPSTSYLPFAPLRSLKIPRLFCIIYISRTSFPRITETPYPVSVCSN